MELSPNRYGAEATIAARIRRLVPALIALAAAALLVAVSTAVVVASWPTLRPNCTVRYAGTAANIEFSGLGAGGDCNQLVWQSPAYSEGKPSGEVMCRANLKGITATVRDSGRFRWAGLQMCDYVLYRQSEGLGL